MATTVQAKNVDVKQLLPLEEYLAVLVQEFPTPIRATLLAEKSNRTKAAVTKVRERLLNVCDKTVMALDKGFLLLGNVDVIFALFLVFAANGQHQEFLSS